MATTNRGRGTKKEKSATNAKTTEAIASPITETSTETIDPTLDTEVVVNTNESANNQETIERKVPLWEALGNIQLLTETLADEDGEIDPEVVREFLQQSHEQARAAISRMTRAIQVRQRYIGVRTEEAKTLRADAARLSGMVRSDERRVNSIKQGILGYFIATNTQRLEVDTAKLHLTSSSRVIIDEKKVPDLLGILQLNGEYPGIINTLKFDEQGKLCDVEWRLKAIGDYIKSGAKFAFATIDTSKTLVLRQGKGESSQEPLKQVNLLES